MKAIKALCTKQYLLACSQSAWNELEQSLATIPPVALLPLTVAHSSLTSLLNAVII